MIEICAIASGSNGNCYYIGNSETAILIDVGITRKQVLMRMAQKNLNPNKIKAIFVSHEHTDHSCGARVLSAKINVPVFMTYETLKGSWHKFHPKKTIFFKQGEIIKIGDFAVHTFLKQHDAEAPCSFRVEYSGINVGVFTDLGAPCKSVISNLQKCHALFLESNYDEEMLWTGSYPDHLKLRISSDYGHLSNNQAFELLKKYHNPNLKLVLLSHLSQENNRPEIAMAAFKELEKKFEIKLTNRYEAGDVFTISL